MHLRNRPPREHSSPRTRFLPILCATLAGAMLCATRADSADAIPGPSRLPVATVISEERGAVVIRLQAPAPDWRGSGRYLYPVIAGFGTLSEKDRPALPVRVERVGVPLGAQPKLTILDSVQDSPPPGVVGPVQNWVPILPGDSEFVPLTTEDPTTYGVDALYPADDPVRLGEPGLLREQPFVDLIFTPILHNPGNGSSIAYRSVTVRIDFGIVPPMAPPSLDTDFEGTYDLGLVNSHQSRSFRGTGWRAAPEFDADLGTSQSGLTTLSGGRYAAAALSTQYKLIVNRDGIYRLGVSWISANAPALLSFNPASYRMDCLGQQVPITVVDVNADGTFNGSDYIEFNGQALTWDILSPDDWDSGDFTDDTVYWLYADSGAVVRAPMRSGAPVSGYSVPADFAETIHQEINNRFQPLVPQDRVDHWYQDPPLVANNAAVTQNYTVNTPGVSTGVSTDQIKVRLLGDSYLNNSHRSRVLVNGSLVSGPSDWDGFREFTHGVDDAPATFPQSLLNDGTPATAIVTVSLPLGRTVGSTPITRDIVYENWIEISYGRQFRVDTDANGDGTVIDDQMLTFSVPNQNMQLHVTGLTQPSAAIYEITRTLGTTPVVNPVRITGAQVAGTGPYSVDFEVAFDGTLPGGAKRRFAVATITTSTATGDLVPAAVKIDIPSSLRAPSGGADWLVIANGSFLDAAPASAWQQLLARRQAQGLRVKVVDVEDVYDEFSFGVSDPEGIRSFIAYVYSSWPRIDPGIPLKYVVLLGDASFDYKNSYGNAQNRNLLSTYMRSVSSSTILGWMSDETYFSTVSGTDPLPDVYVGRWPVHNVAETDAIAQKILTYETAPTGQAWQSDFVFVADDGDPAFEQVQDEQINNFLVPTPSTWHRTYEGKIKAANPGWPGDQVAAEAKDRIQRQLNGTVDATRDIGPGAAVLSYVGHGSWYNWGDNFAFFETASSGADSLTPVSNPNKLPLVLVADCLSAGFAVTSSPAATTDLTYAICDDFMDTAGKGAIGFIAPSHLTYSTGHSTVESTFFGEMFGRRKVRNLGALNTAIQTAFAATNSVLDIRSYTLFGDPALNLAVPAPKPPTNVTAVAGNHQVVLSWTGSPDAAAYNVYQSTNPASSSQRVGTNVVGSGYTVTGLSNCTTYYYALVSVDSRGFEGAWSHLNAGCGAGGSCLTATPAAPAAPLAPTGVTAVDAETGGTILVQWSPNATADDVQEYKVYWGTSPGSYTQSLTAGAATSYAVSGLTNGVTYHFAVSALNCSHGEGAKSTGAQAVPHRIEGIKPPNSVGDLRVFRSPDPGDHIDNARLQWTPPTTNIYGQPTTIASQEIYAGTTPGFQADAAHRLATVSGSTGSYIHANGFGDALNHYYLVVAIDAAGNRSGIGGELPSGVDQLIVKKSGGNLLLSWPAVKLNVDGFPTTVSSYTLYGRAATFRRSDLGTTPVVASNLGGTSAVVSIPAGTFFCYSLIAVDNRGALSPW